jgi:hypothetical protein
MSDFYEEDESESGKERGCDKTEVEEEPAVEPVAMGGKDATKEGIAAIIIDAVSDDALALSFWMRINPILRVDL